MNLRTNCFSLVIEEYDSLNNKHITENDICNYCMDNECIDFYALILHDRDLAEDNITLKRKHYHLVIHTVSQYIKSTILTNFSKDLLLNRCCIQCRIADLIPAIQYLTHSNDKDKYQYDLTDIYSNDYEQVMDILDYGLSKSTLDVKYILNVVNSSENLTEVYCKLGLKTSKLYGNIIRDIWRENH